MEAPSILFATGDGASLVSAWPSVTGSVVGAAVAVGVSVGVGSTGVIGGLVFASFNRRASRFFSSVRRKTLIVVRRDLFGLQSPPETGVCSQTGHEEGRVDWPIMVD